MLKRSIEFDDPFELSIEEKIFHNAKRVCVMFAVVAVTISGLDLMNIRPLESAAEFVHQHRNARVADWPALIRSGIDEFSISTQAEASVVVAIPADRLATPAEITPEWYFWPYYAMLRSFTSDFFFIPAKLMGVMAMFTSILVWFFLPWLDTSPVRSGRYRPAFKKFFWVLVIDVVVLGYCGGMPAEQPYLMIAQIATAYYFLHFLVVLPLVGWMETPKPLPFSITEAVLGSDDEARLEATS